MFSLTRLSAYASWAPALNPPPSNPSTRSRYSPLNRSHAGRCLLTCVNIGCGDGICAIAEELKSTNAIRQSVVRAVRFKVPSLMQRQQCTIRTVALKKFNVIGMLIKRKRLEESVRVSGLYARSRFTTLLSGGRGRSRQGCRECERRARPGCSSDANRRSERGQREVQQSIFFVGAVYDRAFPTR